jgi:cutinase
MKASLALALASVALAAPAADLEKRQITLSASELKGPCKDVTFIWVRGTTEFGTLVSSFLHSRSVYCII